MYSDLRKLREERGLSAKQLADLAGLPEEKIQEIENGIFPEMDELVCQAKELGMKPEELFQLKCDTDPCPNCPYNEGSVCEDI